MSYRDNSLESPAFEGFTKDQIDDLEAQFAAQQTLVNLCCIPSGIAFLLAAHWVLVALSQHLIQSDGLSGYRIAYQPVFLWFFPGFGALSGCFEITLQVWALFVGRHVVELYAAWDATQPKESHGRIVYYNARKTLRWFFLLVAFPIGILTGLALNMHTTFDGSGVHEFGYAFTVPVAHSYTSIVRITFVHGTLDKHGHLVEHPGFVLDFNDGHRWQQSNSDPDRKTVDQQLLAILVQKTHLPIWNAETVGDIMPPPVP